MKHITFYLDFSSPDCALAFEQLPLTLMGHSYSMTYKPVLLAELQQPAKPALPAPTRSAPNRYICETRFKAGASEGGFTDEAQALGLLALPAIGVDGQLFWGLDVLAQLQAHLAAASVAQGTRR
jgi:2-hydroxychromene-2-carboxylate isomerase